MDAGAEELGEATSQAQLEQNLDPGPVDKSVLVEQELHKSEAISVGKVYKPIRFIEHGTRLNQWEVRHKRVLSTLQRAGFYHLSFLKRVQLDHALLNALVERWRRETQTFHLRFGEMTVLLKDVAVLTGLRVHGTPVTGPTDCCWEQLCLELLGQEPPRIKGGSINIAWLHDTFQNLPEGANQSDIEHATRAYILYQFGCSLFPDPSGTRVHLRYLALLRDFDASGEMAWGAAVLAHLYRELGKSSMKGKANCCAFLTLLQIWAWEHIQIGRPERLGNKALTDDQPLGCRWNAPFKNRENARSMDHEFYRHGLDTLSDCQITWDPYSPSLVGDLPALCTVGSAVWRSRTPLICFQIVEMHVPDRVLLQFGMMQHIPDPVEVVQRVTMQGKADEDWSTYHDKYIKQWVNRLSSVVEQKNTRNSDTTYARNCYLEWYWQITRRWISTPVECPVIAYQLSDHSDRVLVDLAMTVQRRIRTLLSNEINGKKVKESLNDIDTYITAELEKAKQCTTEPRCLNYKWQHMILSSTSPQVMQIVGNECVESAINSSNFVDSVVATTTKVEQGTNDCAEGNTILQLDQMRRILPSRGTPDLGPPTADGTNRWTEDVHQQEDPLVVSMTEVNLRDIISTPVEDAITEIMNTSAEDAALEEASDTEMKNGEVHPLTPCASIETVEVLEAIELLDNKKIFLSKNDNKKIKKKVTAESQESAAAPNGTVEENISVFMKDNYVVEITHMDPRNTVDQGSVSKPLESPGSHKILGVYSHNFLRQKIASGSRKGDKIEDIVDMRGSISIDQGAMQRPLNASELGENSNASVNKLSIVRGDAERPSGSEMDPAVPWCNNLRDTVKTRPKNNVVQDIVSDLGNRFSSENFDDQIENGTLDTAVVQKSDDVPAEDLHNASIQERHLNLFARETTDAPVREVTTNDADHCSPHQSEISKRKRLKFSSHENAEGLPSIEVAKMRIEPKTEDEFRPYVRSGGSQLITFTRRKRKKACMQSSP